MGKRSKRLQRKTGKRGRKGFGASMGHIPPFTPTIKFSHKFRYVNGTNAGSYTITRMNLLNQVLVATGATDAVRIFEAVRLRMVEIWANPTALGSAPTTCSLEWLGMFGPSTVVSDTTMGVSPAHVRTSPPRASSDQWWSMSGFNESDSLFTMVLPADCVIEVILDVRLVEQESPTLGDPVTGATPGQLYGDYLDGSSSGKLAPVGFTVLP